jgi:anion-transporting  ArsA/GET3 family ATPase
METMKKINLMNGEFNSIEAREILLDMCNKNINFNKVQNFSSQIRFGEDDEKALNRINQLKETVSSITEILEEAKAHNKKLKIKSFIEIEYED